jgi:nicotinamide mononucleotide (NMN) deamidase PncC
MSSTNNSIEQVAKRLVHNSSAGKSFVCIAVAGGGGHAISTLAATPGASSLFLEGTVAYDRNSLQAYLGQRLDDTTTKFVSKETAKLMSRAAVRHAMQYRPNVDDYPYCMGVGITSALISSDQERTKGSFGYICATLADGSELNLQVVLQPNARTRAQEDVVMGTLALQAIEQLQQQQSSSSKDDELTKFVKPEGDFNDTIDESHYPVTPKDEVKAAAERILSGEVKSVLLLPSSNNNKSSSFMAVTDPVLPMESLVFPGSFNPPHNGHTTLAQVASRAWAKRSCNTTAPVFWELSLTNPDKPSMDPNDVSARAHKFLELVPEMPEQWGILLTSAPLFKEKVEGLRPFMVAGKQQIYVGVVVVVAAIIANVLCCERTTYKLFACLAYL